MPKDKTRSWKYARPVVPDKLDLRDRPYRPTVALSPPPRYDALSRARLPVLDQGDTNACTGFALSNVVNFLLRVSRRDPRAEVSPFMLYSMARRYDEFPGASADSGSSLRGAMKGWFKHGACTRSLWPAYDMPKAQRDPARDWWQDSANRPLGAYYRVDTRSVTDMHVALQEAGVLYASVVCHAGWDAGSGLPPDERKGWVIPFRKAGPDDGGHAIVIVGYDRDGFRIQNSWGEEWGDGGVGILTYEDWIENAMDCWVAQLGVVTEQHRQVAGSLTLRTGARGRVILAAEDTLRNREISPFIVDMENNGDLSGSGEFRTGTGDLESLVTLHLDEARERWNLGSRPMDVAIYAHGGLTGEDTAAATAAKWIPALYEARIFPVFFMWETDLWSTLKNRLADFVHGEPRATGGIGDSLLKFWDARLEKGLAAPGSMIWGEMKQNAEAISSNPESGARQLYRLSRQVAGFGPDRVRLHLIGHSAGSIVHSHLAAALGDAGWKFSSVHFMAPAVRVDTFRDTLLKQIRAGNVGSYYQYHLTDAVEQKDPTCRPLLGYGRSLLYLVSQSFEGGHTTPILGMQRYWDPLAAQARDPRMQAFASPSDRSASTTHGGFDDDPATRRSVIDLIKAQSAEATTGRRAGRGAVRGRPAGGGRRVAARRGRAGRPRRSR